MMQNLLYVGLTQQMALRRQMEVIANNIANANTPAFKSDRMMFTEYLAPVAIAPGVSGPGNRLAFVQDLGTLRETTDGALARTGNALDVALTGPGYFSIQTPGGIRYTRNGEFRLDGNGQLVTNEGFAVLGDGDRPITFQPTDSQVQITREGTITAESGDIGRLKVVRFENEQAMKRVGGGIYETDEPPLPKDQRTEIHQGTIEGSNVQSVIEISSMIEMTRRYQSAQRILDNDHERARRAIEKLVRAG